MSTAAIAFPPVAHTDQVLAIVNRNASGLGRTARARSAAGWAVARALRAAGAEAELIVTESIDDLLTAVFAAEGRRVVLVGGDGALHALANLGLTLPPEIALIPAGRANNIARGLGIPTDLAAAARLAVRGRARAFDLVDVHAPGRWLRAVEGVSLGFQAAARARYHAENSGALLAGSVALARTLLELPRFRARVSFDGAPAEELAFEQAFLSTLPYFAYGLRVNPVADPRDGADEAIVVRARSRREAVGVLLAARRGRPLDAGLRRWRTAEVLDPVPVAVDGESLGVTTVRLEVLGRALRVVAGS